MGGVGEGCLVEAWDLARGRAREISTLALLLPSSLLPVLPVGQMQQNPEGKQSRFHSGWKEVERDAERELYCNDLVSPLLRDI